MSLIEFKNVSHKDILHNITGSFKENKITTLVGPSGAGKTTCLKHINSLLSPSQGNIYFKGQDIEQINKKELRKEIGMAFQSSPMIEGTVYDNLNLPKSIFNEKLDTAIAKDLLACMDLSHIDLNQKVKVLSGGERSRLSIARTLVNEPKVLLLDEITSSVEYRMVREIERLICQLQKNVGLTAIWITHDLEQARRVSDDMWFLKDGHLLEFGEASLINQSDNTYIQSFVRGEYE
ncbi:MULTISPECIES: ATP-binding cassette domain-containing protein [Jeotgalicoccus]|uniref:ABC transporter ATP-binding protein n=1 Tax=Jeotgalicoccus TaxID=227979 RepID=UPI00042545F9|nr:MULTISPECIES: ATP-binding cassette domain-containing protein [Jeotgalicoccus]QQD85227.1 ATP-binding cassette domain-containing protein [Jeotgalicoccus sp. ATCC 8456]